MRFITQQKKKKKRKRNENKIIMLCNAHTIGIYSINLVYLYYLYYLFTTYYIALFTAINIHFIPRCSPSWPKYYYSTEFFLIVTGSLDKSPMWQWLTSCSIFLCVCKYSKCFLHQNAGYYKYESTISSTSLWLQELQNWYYIMTVISLAIAFLSKKKARQR